MLFTLPKGRNFQNTLTFTLPPPLWSFVPTSSYCLGVVAQALISTLEKQRQENHGKFDASLNYILSSELSSEPASTLKTDNRVKTGEGG